MLIKKSLILFSLVLFLGGTVAAQGYKYIGADKCKMCHNKPSTGDQYAKWAGSLHAKALKSLSSPEALDYAKKNGIAWSSTAPPSLGEMNIFGNESASEKDPNDIDAASLGIFVRNIAGSIDLYRSGDKGAAETVHSSLLGYAGLLKNHIAKENNILFRMADNALSDEEQESLSAEFNKVEKSMAPGGTSSSYIAQIEKLAVNISL